MVGVMAMRLTSKSTATAYRFRSDDHRCSWAICTVNDATGELSVQSDAGSWAHRWNIDHLGGGKTLTQFLGDRDGVHYLFGKLTTKQDEQVDVDGTIRHCLETIRRQRRDGLSKTEARRAYDWVKDSGDDYLSDSVDVWLSEMPDYVTDVLGSDVYESIRMAPTCSAVVLRDLILPALIEACRAEVP